MYQNPRLSELLSMYLAHLEAAGKGKGALGARKEQLHPLVHWCRLRGVEYAPQVSLALLESYQRYLRSYRKANGELMRVNGQIARLSCLRGLFRWLLEKHYILYDPASRLVMPREEWSERYLTDNDIMSITKNRGHYEQKIFTPIQTRSHSLRQ